MILSCPRCDHRFSGGDHTAVACPACNLVFRPGEDDNLLAKVTPPESYVDTQRARIAAQPGAEEPIVLTCHAHPDVEALGRCDACGRAICEWCNVVDHGAPQCETCYFNDVLELAKQGPVKPSELTKRGFDPRQPVLWEMRSSLGRSDALQRTWREIMLRPAHFFHTMPLVGDSWSPLIFALSWATFGLLLWRVWAIGGLLLHYRDAVERGDDPFSVTARAGMSFWDSLGTEVTIILLVPLFALTLFLAEVAVFQTLLMVLGERHARIRITWRLVGYAAAPWALLLVPGIGLPLAVATHLGVLATALRQGYHLAPSRAWLVSATPYAVLGMVWYARDLQGWAHAGYRFFFGG